MSSDKMILNNKVKKYIISILIGLIFYFIGVFFTSFILYATSTDSRFIFFIPYIFIVIGGLVSSKYLYKKSNRRGFEVGIKAGVLYSFVVGIFSFLFCLSLSAFVFVMIITALLSCIAGGVFAANSRK